MEERLVDTITSGKFRADIYSTSLPGEFRVVYRDGKGSVLEEAPLTGISTYKQRETEIVERLRKLAHGASPQKTPDRGDSGEY